MLTERSSDRDRIHRRCERTKRKAIDRSIHRWIDRSFDVSPIGFPGLVPERTR